MTERGASPDEMLFYRIVPAIPASVINLHFRLAHHKVAGWLVDAPRQTRPDVGLDLFAGAQVVQKLRRRAHRGHEQMVASPGACHIEQMTLGRVDLFQIGLVPHAFDSGLQVERRRLGSSVSVTPSRMKCRLLSSAPLATRYGLVVSLAAMLRRSSIIALIFACPTGPERLIRVSFSASSAAREMSA